MLRKIKCVFIVEVCVWFVFISGCALNINDEYKYNDEDILVVDNTLLNDNDANNNCLSENVDLIFFMGQSNMCGYGGNAVEAPLVTEEAGMEFRVISDPSRLYPIREPFGFYENNKDGLRDDTTVGRKKGSLASAFINKYHEVTGNKVVAVSCSVGGMAMDLWLIDGFWNDAVGRVTNSITWLDNNNYNVEHIYVVWYQGESDMMRQVPVSEYSANFEKFMNSLIDSGVQHIFLIVPKRTGEVGDAICDYQEKMCEENENYSIGSLLPSEFQDISYTADTIHFTQDVLNKIGDDAGNSAGQYTMHMP